MKSEVAVALLCGLVERIECDQIGTITRPECEALREAVRALGGEAPALPVAKPISPPLPTIQLDLTSVRENSSELPGVLMCLDFGTAMSKAFAMSESTVYPLALGEGAGGQGYAVPSSIYIDNNGKAYFGFQAIERSESQAVAGRERRDSIKSQLSLRVNGDLDAPACLLPASVNPTSIKLTEGDVLRVLLAFLTDHAGLQMQAYANGKSRVGRYVLRRFAHPCWPDPQQREWADRLMRRLLAEAQVLADTFSGKWSEGIDVAVLKAAVSAVRELGKVPEHLIAEGVAEPVAVSTAALDDGEPKRLPFMVIDVGAGTTDFGVFVILDRGEGTRIFQIPNSVHGLMQAGDKIDHELFNFVSERERVERDTQQGQIVAVALRQRIRDLKETLFATGQMQYRLADGTVGRVDVQDFLASRGMRQFSELVAAELRKTIEGVGLSWQRFMARTGLRIVTTGGGARLPMIEELTNGVIEVNGNRILCSKVERLPGWIEEALPDFVPLYPQLAVAIGGAAEELPELAFGPEQFGGDVREPTYVATRIQTSGL